jgi:demethylmenaquinone methyltransferase/2-methoxy-6-polyprenyl-1,4-benzoquinol methylase
MDHVTDGASDERHPVRPGTPGPADAPPRRSRHGHFELAAPWYDLVFGRSDVSSLLQRLAIEPGMAVVDIGGGTGRVAERLADVGADVLVLDVSPAMLDRARGRSLAAAVALAESLPIRTGEVDRVVVVDAFHHFAHQAWAARELVRILRPGGRLVIEEPDIRRAMTKGVALGERLARMQTHFMPPAAMARLLEDAGGRLLAIEPEGWSIHLVVAKPEARTGRRGREAT